MGIVSATYTDWGAIKVVFEGQPPDTVITVPPDPDNKDYVELMEWEAEGGVIHPYEPPQARPVEPTLEERVAAIEAKLGM